MGCEASRPERKMSCDKGILQLEAQKEGEKSNSVDPGVQSQVDISRRVSERVEYSSDDHKKPRKTAVDQTRSRLSTVTKPLEITKEAKLKNVGLAQKVQVEEQAKGNGSDAESPRALDPSRATSEPLNITVHDSRSNLVFDSLTRDSVEKTQTLPVLLTLDSPIILPQRATSCTILGTVEEGNRAEEELKSAKQKLTKSESIISEKDKRIKQLLDENLKLKRKTYHRSSISMPPVLANKSSTRFKDKIRDIKKATNFDSGSWYRSQRSDGEQSFAGTTAATSQETMRSKTPDAEIVSAETKSDKISSRSLYSYGELDQIPDVPLKFGFTVEESKKRRQTRDEAGYKSNNNEAYYSEMMMI